MKNKTYEVGDIVTGCVTGIENYGIFVGLEYGYSGLIHISEISNSYVRNVNDFAVLGEMIKVEVLEVSKEDLRLRLGIKNIDYRIDYKNSPKILETPNGFKTLGVKLPLWIQSKEQEILTKKR